MSTLSNRWVHSGMHVAKLIYASVIYSAYHIPDAMRGKSGARLEQIRQFVFFASSLGRRFRLVLLPCLLGQLWLKGLTVESRVTTYELHFGLLFLFVSNPGEIFQHKSKKKGW